MTQVLLSSFRRRLRVLAMTGGRFFRHLSTVHLGSSDDSRTVPVSSCHLPTEKMTRPVPVSCYKMQPSSENVTTCQGMNFPDVRRASVVMRSKPPQHGTSMRVMVTLLMSLFAMISASFSE